MINATVVSMDTLKYMMRYALTNKSLKEVGRISTTPTTALERFSFWLLNVFSGGAHAKNVERAARRELAQLNPNAERIVTDLLVLPYNPDGTTQIDPRIQVGGRILDIRQEEGGLTIFDSDHPSESFFLENTTVRSLASHLLIAYTKMLKLDIGELGKNFHLGNVDFTGVELTRQHVERIVQEKGDLRGAILTHDFDGDKLILNGCTIDQDMVDPLIESGVHSAEVLQCLIDSRGRLGMSQVDVREFDLPKQFLDEMDFDFALISIEQCQEIINAGGKLDKAILEKSENYALLDLTGARFSKAFALQMYERGVPHNVVVKSYIASERAAGNKAISLEGFDLSRVDLARIRADDVLIPEDD